MKVIILASLVFYLTTFGPEICESYRILGVFPYHGKSHFVIFETLMKALARKGHQVDVISVFRQERPYPNYTDIIELPLTSQSVTNNVTYDWYTKSLRGDWVQFVATYAGNKVCESLGHPKMTKLLRNPHHPPYDIVITEVYGAHCYLALGHYFKAPVVAFTPSPLYLWANDLIANPPNLAFVPNNLFNFHGPMTFWQRVRNTVENMYSNVAFKVYSSPQDEIIRKYLGESAPTVREAERSLALILANSHLSLDGPKPVTPALIEVAGLHVQDDDTQLPQELKEWMDNSSAGFVYFTFGSMVLIESFPQKIIQVIYKSLGKISPVRVLIKIPNPDALPAGLPENFRTFKWSPQIKVLKHKNIKAFITHGGLMSTQEAIHYGVPMIGMPLFIDQFINIDRYANMKIAVRVDPESMTEKILDEALNEILYNPLYKNTMSRVSEKFLDRPMNPLDTAVWWVEYIGRHGSNALRSPAMDLTWWQIELLDVYGFILLNTAIAIILAIKLFKYLINICDTSTASKIRHSKKSQ